MQQILVYSDSLSWGIVPLTRNRLAFDARWPGVMENRLNEKGRAVRVIEDCLNGRRTVWNCTRTSPGATVSKASRSASEINSPLALVVLALGTNDFQSMHSHGAWQSAQGIAALVAAVRGAPIGARHAGAPVLVMAPPPFGDPRGRSRPKFAGGEVKSRASPRNTARSAPSWAAISSMRGR